MITAEGISKSYKANRALDGFDLDVPQGTVCGLLGPNGAGKTTAVKILATLTRHDRGRATVNGYDVSTQARRVKASIGLLGQHAALDEVLSARQNLVMFGRLFHLGAKHAARRADELLSRFELADTGTKEVLKFSGGMRRRLDLAASLIRNPPVLFLDEPTTGLDPRGRNEVWQAIRALARDGTTVLLTTQYLEEADQLADAIVLIDGGRVVAEGTPAELKAHLGAGRVEVKVRRAEDLPRANEILKTCEPRAGQELAALIQAAQAFQAEGIEVEDIGLRRPTLDEVFLSLTGRGNR
ncbi:MAG TPA: ATP-binding cassette domain-containing protein [Candidatus Limnocylindrales bacterium]|nr:ATP-binding cassette domain-containing protein [Candidatus Limnocylindrales bacterium]